MNCMNPLFHPHFVKFIVYFNENQDFFECHEELEDYWKSLPNYSKKHPLTAYILYAVSAYHWRRANTSGASKTINKAIQRFASIDNNTNAFTQGIHFEQLLNDMKDMAYDIANDSPFHVKPIIVTDEQLQRQVNAMKRQLSLLPHNSASIIHKHILRHK